MPTPFLSSEEYDERAHQLYNEGSYDEALDVLREGLALYPNSVELHVGVGYARMARDEYAWARRAFEEALVLDPEHEDAIAGLGEVLLKFGRRDEALKCFRRVLDLGYEDDLDLMLQVGRALFREDCVEEAREFFAVAVEQAPELAEAVACLGYAQHRLEEEESAVKSLRRALELDGDHTEARIYLANLLYDRGEYAESLAHFEKTSPDDHWEEMGIQRCVELKKAAYRLKEDAAELKPWDERVTELNGDPDPLDEMLEDVARRVTEAEENAARQQLELFGTLLTEMADRKESGEESAESDIHRVELKDVGALSGTWDEIMQSIRDASPQGKGRSIEDFMRTEARRVYAMSGVELPSLDAEALIRAYASAGFLRIVR